MDSQFDAFVRAYENYDYMPFRLHIEAESFFAALGSVEGRDVLDVGCGAGLYTRQIKRRGAARVVGLDASPAMVGYAREREEGERIGVEFQVDDVANAAKYGAFDVITGVYVLPYAGTEEQLAAMCRGLYDALRPGGRLVAMPTAPTIRYEPADLYRPYGFTLAPIDARPDDEGRVPDGTPLRLRSHVPEIPLDVVAHHWNTDTQTRIFWEAGFSSVTWHRPRASPAGVERYGRAIWRDYLARPHSAPVVCVK